MLQFSCPECGKKYKAPESSAGKAMKCRCGKRINIPAPAKEPAAPPQEAAAPIQPKEGVISLQPKGVMSPEPDEGTISMQEEQAAVKAPVGAPPGPPGEAGKDSEWQPMWSKERFDQQKEERPPTISWKGVVFIILAATIVPALGFYANYGYKGYLANAAFRNGMKALNDGDNEEAAEQFSECIEMRPEWSAAYLPAARLAYEGKDLEEADYLLEELADLDDVPYRDLVYNNLAAVAMAQEKPKYDEAQSYFEKAVEEDTSCAPANLGLALLSYDKAKIKEASKYLEGMKRNVSDLSDEGAATYNRMRMRIAFTKGDKEKFLSGYMIAIVQRQDITFEREAGLMALEILLAQPDFDKVKDMPLFILARRANTPEREGDHYVLVQMAIAGLLGMAGMHSERAAELEKIVKPEDSASEFTHMLARACAAAARDTLDKDKKAEQEERALELYKEMVGDRKSLGKKGKSLILEAVGFCARAGRRESAWAFLKKGMDKFPGDARFHRMAGALCFQDRKFKEGIDHFEKSLNLDPSQENLKEEVKSYRVPPSFTDFRPSKPEDFVLRPLIHIKVKSGSRFQIKKKSIKLLLDGEPQKMVMGGNEGFYLPPGDLPGGEHVAEFSAEDAVGNSGSRKFTFWVDLAGPVAKLVRPAAVTKETQPTIEIKLEDELSAVALETVTIVMRSAPGNPYDVTIPIVFQGQYSLTDKSHGIEHGSPVSGDGNVAFRIPKPLKPGAYLIMTKMSDSLGNSSKGTLTFTIEAETEDADE